MTVLPPRTHLLTRTLHLPLPRPDVFAFFADAHNLARITPPELRFRIVHAPDALSQGALIDYRLSLFGIPFGWQTEISAWEPPHRFVDEQRRGPYRVWHHTHTFAKEAGGTRIDDEVRYALPLCPLGEIAHPLVRWQLNRIFDFRQQAIREIFGT
jgi:ligand-binding SRPBCC domain-containing protein